jgi:hypothetical protein
MISFFILALQGILVSVLSYFAGVSFFSMLLLVGVCNAMSIAYSFFMVKESLRKGLL